MHVIELENAVKAKERQERVMELLEVVGLADEPTANLDTANGAQAIGIMQRLNQETGTAFIFATHDPRVMSYAQRVIELHNGRVSSNGEPIQ